MVVVVCPSGSEKWAFLIANAWPLVPVSPVEVGPLCLYDSACLLVVTRAPPFNSINQNDSVKERGLTCLFRGRVGATNNVTVGHPYHWAIVSLKAFPSSCDQHCLLGHTAPSCFSSLLCSPSLQHVTWLVQQRHVTCWACDLYWEWKYYDQALTASHAILISAVIFTALRESCPEAVALQEANAT